MMVRNVNGELFRLENFTQTAFGKTFQKAQRIRGTYMGKPIGSPSTFISDDSIIEYWEEE